MTHLLDTDHMTFLQLKSGPDYAMLVVNMSHHPLGDIGVSVVSLHEQFLGAHAEVNSARTQAQLLRGYTHVYKLIGSYRELSLAEFDAGAATEFDNLKALKLGVKTMDLRIAAIALAKKLVLVTRNARDFGKVPGLTTEDWTK